MEHLLHRGEGTGAPRICQSCHSPTDKTTRGLLLGTLCCPSLSRSWSCAAGAALSPNFERRRQGKAAMFKFKVSRSPVWAPCVLISDLICSVRARMCIITPCYLQVATQPLRRSAIRGPSVAHITERERERERESAVGMGQQVGNALPAAAATAADDDDGRAPNGLDATGQLLSLESDGDRERRKGREPT